MGKQSANDKKDLAVLEALAAQNRQMLETPSGLWVLMVLVGLATAGLPLGLFLTSHYTPPDSVSEGAPFFTIGALASSVVLATAYNQWAVSVRKALYRERESTISTLRPEVRAGLEKNTFTESTARAVFYQNIAFFLAYWYFTSYLIPAWVADDKWNYLFSSIFASGLTLGWGSLYQQIRL